MHASNSSHLRVLITVVAAALLVACGGDGGGEASVSFTSPEDGAEVSSPVQVEMAAEGLEIEPSGEVREGAGHFHIMIDTSCVTPGETIPEDDSHRHFGDGSTSAELELEPGEHELCLQAGDGAHEALDATDETTVNVTE